MPAARTPTDLISIREAARRLGLSSDNSVRKRIRDGRLETYGDPPRVSLAEVQAAFGRTSPTQVMAGNSRAVLPEESPERTAAAPEPDAGADDDHGRAGKRIGADLLQRTAALHKVRQTKLLDLKIQAAEERLVDRQAAAHRFYELAREQRDAWLAWPDAAAGEIAADLEAELQQQHPGLTIDHRVMHEVLSRHVRAHLAAQAELQIDLRPTGE